MNYITLIVVGVLMVPMASTIVQAAETDETAAACNEAARLLTEDDDIDGALEEARWCVEGLQQLKQNQLLTILPDAIEGYTGGEIENQSALGMNIIERAYTGPAGSIQVSLTSGVASGGLAALAQMGMSLGASGGKKMRIQKRTVFDMSEPNGDSQFMVKLKNGGVINISSSTVSGEDTLLFIKGFPIAEIDDALRP